MKVRYTGSALDYSGYGEANRHDIIALLSAGVDVGVELTRHCFELTDFGELGQKIIALQKPSDAETKIKILHTTPNIYGRFMEEGKYHIGRVFWETSKLPEEFMRGINQMNEVWTGSEFNAAAIRNSGLKADIPIHIIPEVINPLEDIEPLDCDIAQQKAFTFYSIFEWTDRKNPEALLTAYWQEFQGVEDVALVIKTYLDNFSREKKREIDQNISLIKKKLKLESYPDLYLYRNLMDREQIYRFHKTFDCFVSAHRGEGWGIPQMEAMSQGNLVISTACGGIHEHIYDVAKLVDYKMVQLTENNRNKQWYTSDQKWAEIDIKALRKEMRWAYENRKEAKEIGRKAKKAANARFSPEVVGRMMLNRLEEIQLSL